MIQLYTDVAAGVVTPVGTPITFQNEKLRAGCSATANVPTNVVNLNTPGVYKVSFDAVLANNTAAAGEVGVIMQNAGVADVSAQSAETSTGATDFVAISFSALIRVLPSCCAVTNRGRLSFNITGVDALVRHANVVVTKEI